MSEHVQKCWDAITQQELQRELTSAARPEELDFMEDWRVWNVMPIEESSARTGKAPLKSA